MNKTEYIDMLRRHISEVGDPAFINDTVEYYRDYIDTAIRKGQSEADVLASLGDPRLIAKSIVASRDNIPEGTYREAGQYNQEDSDDNTYGRGEGHYGEYENAGRGFAGHDYGIYDGKLHLRLRNGKKFSLPLPIVKVGGAAVLILLLFGAGYIAVQLLPVIGVGLLAVLIYRFFRDNFR